MPQTAVAKEYLRNAPRTTESLFPWRKRKPLVDFLDRHTPENALVILFGGDRGVLGVLMQQKRRQFLNMDIAGHRGGHNVEHPTLIPTMAIDLEVPMDRAYIEAVRRESGNAEVTIISPFSIGFMDPVLVKANIAAFLGPGEKWIDIDYRIGETERHKLSSLTDINGIVNRLGEQIGRNADRPGLTREMKSAVRSIIGEEIDEALEMLDRDLKARLLLVTIPPETTAEWALHIVNNLTLYAMGILDTQDMMDFLSIAKERLHYDMQISEQALKTGIASHKGMKERAGEQFSLIHPGHYTDTIDTTTKLVYLLGVFERNFSISQ